MNNNSFFKQLNRQDRYILICCFFIFAVNGLYSMILGSLLPLISEEYMLNNTISGALLSAHQVGNLIAGFVAGILPLYLGRKKSILFLCSFVIVGFSIMLLTGNPVLLILGFIFTGLSRGSISNFNNSVVNEVSNSSTVALNILHSVFAVGALAAPFLVIFSTNIVGDSGWRLSIGVIIFLIVISIIMFSQMKIDDQAKEKSKKDGLSYGFLKNIGFWVSAAIFFLYLCAESAINGWLVKYFVDSNIMSIKYAQMLASLLWAVILIGRLITAFLSDKISRNLLLLITSIGTAVFYFLLLSTKNLTIITIAIAGLGLSMAGIYPTMVAVEGNTIKEYPMAMGTLLMIGGIGSIIMPLLTGALSDEFGIFAGMTAIIFAIIVMVILIFARVIKNRPSNNKIEN